MDLSIKIKSCLLFGLVGDVLASNSKTYTENSVAVFSLFDSFLVKKYEQKENIDIKTREASLISNDLASCSAVSLISLFKSFRINQVYHPLYNLHINAIRYLCFSPKCDNPSVFLEYLHDSGYEIPELECLIREVKCVYLKNNFNMAFNLVDITKLFPAINFQNIWAQALYVFCMSFTQPENTINNAIALGGQEVCAIAKLSGEMCGAKFGTRVFKEDYRTCEVFSLLETQIDKLYNSL